MTQTRLTEVKDMHSTETHGKFLELRSSGLSLVRIPGRIAKRFDRLTLNSTLNHLMHRFCTISSPEITPREELTRRRIQKTHRKRSLLDRFRGTDRQNAGKPGCKRSVLEAQIPTIRRTVSAPFLHHHPPPCGGNCAAPSRLNCRPSMKQELWSSGSKIDTGTARLEH